MMMMKCQFHWWRKPEYLEETSHLWQVTDQTFTHIRPVPSPSTSQFSQSAARYYIVSYLIQILVINSHSLKLGELEFVYSSDWHILPLRGTQKGAAILDKKKSPGTGTSLDCLGVVEWIIGSSMGVSSYRAPSIGVCFLKSHTAS